MPKTMKNKIGGAALIGVALFILLRPPLLLFEIYDPGADFILRASQWAPFVQECKEFDYAKFSFDNGAMVFAMHPQSKSAAEYFDAVTRGIAGTGWRELPPGKNRLAGEESWFTTYYGKTVARFTWDSAPGRYHTRKFFPEIPESTYMESVALTYVEGKGTVVFLCWYED